MSESFSAEEIEAVILHNRRIVEDRGEDFEVDRAILDRLFARLRNFNLILERRIRIVTISANLLARLTFDQPFFEGNKETALGVTILFLRRNGFDLPLNTRQSKVEVYDILEKTSLKFAGDPTIVSEVLEFLTGRVTNWST